jgi:small basic protein (TIGR04137 family)
MSIDKSLKRKGAMARTRCVMKRSERILKMMENGSFQDGRSPYGLPKTRVQKVMLKKKVKKEAAEGAEGTAAAAGGATTAAAPAAAGAAKK